LLLLLLLSKVNRKILVLFGLIKNFVKKVNIAVTYLKLAPGERERESGKI
jgi:hypothetical protein